MQLKTKSEITQLGKYDFFLVKEICYRILLSLVGDSKYHSEKFRIYERNAMYVNYPAGGLRSYLLQVGYPALNVVSIDVWPAGFRSREVYVNCFIEEETQVANFSFDEDFFGVLLKKYEHIRDGQSLDFGIFGKQLKAGTFTMK